MRLDQTQSAVVEDCSCIHLSFANSAAKEELAFTFV
jgi:hypothetical protein